MKSTRTLVLLSSAASLSVVANASAADLPVKAKAIEYVRVCSLYGAGFWYIPGTDTCIRIGGYLRADTTFDGSGSHGQPAWNRDSGQRNHLDQNFTGTAMLTPSAPKPSTMYEFKDQDSFMLQVRAQRNF